uniref:Uncharacterized protein n=1 Tax=Monopterus albus TaxID=43700 RepID=A0A3Q3Q5A3_MONAL
MIGRHSPLLQWNSEDEHLPLPSGQSMSPSQTHRRGIQAPFVHWNPTALQVTGGQEVSSLPSSQSFMLSHTEEDDTHWPWATPNEKHMMQRNSRVGGRKKTG